MRVTWKIIRTLHIARDTKKTLKRGERKMKSIRKVWQQKQNSLLLFFVYGKG